MQSGRVCLILYALANDQKENKRGQESEDEKNNVGLWNQTRSNKNVSTCVGIKKESRYTNNCVRNCAAQANA